MDDARGLLLECFRHTLRTVNGTVLVESALHQPECQGNWRVVAVGKAAVAMMQGALRVLGDRITSGLVITKHGHAGGWSVPRRVEIIEAGHPLPDDNSLRAGHALLDFIDAAEEGEPLLFLLSGGASALIEVLPAGVDQEQLAALNRWLLSSGYDIHTMNRLRKRISLIKGGRLAQHLAGRRVLNLLLSDVPGDDPAVIGSGPLVADPDEGLCLPELPEWVNELVELAPPAPAIDAVCFRTIQIRILGGNHMARHAAAWLGEAQGQDVFLFDEDFQGDARQLGEQFAHTLIQGAPGLYVWGGESTVCLPEQPGRGGRNQHLALAAARVLAGRKDVWLLAAGTDGSDGPTDDAGALVDGGTVARGTEAGLDAAIALSRADSGAFLEASGDLLQTGPTGTNVMDLVLGLKR